jgi:alpha-N-arabinofuranosidase
MEMYNVHQDALLLPITISSNEYTLNNEKLTAVSASASKDKNGVTHVSLVNIDAKNSQPISIETFGTKYKTVTARILTSPKLQDHNTFEAPSKIQPVEFKGAKLKDALLQIEMPPLSVIVLELK